MRYLTISKSGIWYFRFQISSEYKHLFDGRSEIKRSLRTSNKHVAKIEALTLEAKFYTSNMLLERLY